jgi:SAM-dependent MidA family methyltransferase
MKDQLMEVFVGYDHDFVEVLRPASAALTDYLGQLQISLPSGFRAEINLEATSWIADVSAALRAGFVTIDYGHSAADLFSREEGTLACYHKHEVHHCPYIFIGEQDITTHVNFSALDHWGKLHGLEYCGYTNQNRFLQGLGLTARLHQMGVSANKLQNLIEMGDKFKVLIQRKGLGRVFLSGLQFAQFFS